MGKFHGRNFDVLINLVFRFFLAAVDAYGIIEIASIDVAELD